ncbi:uncharacterized protein ACA1_150070 [Acanthamoeba castellanii str. Neff]|uniref:Uncharacterized protein n=1 Tax=Acanthamoeba castellanii (strain ATCC 30010 / Neff) TaxID=1257118 RepID=L8HC50_ACACF|nr:uncharacterized protein ACA1_150070 [Acanthamoeba castellanii str. Neff]ELR22817.1 hypothetical protein ACA1_150070 [Acanthamoeba castellanii str. Neff]
MSERKDKAKTLQSYHEASASTSSLLGSVKDGISSNSNSPSSKLSRTMRDPASSSPSTSATSSPSGKDKKEAKKNHKHAKDKEPSVDQEQLLLQAENRPQCECGTACTSQDPLHWVHFQHTPRSPTASASSHEVRVRSSSPSTTEREPAKSGRKTPRGKSTRRKSRDRTQQPAGGDGDDGSSSDSGSGVMGTVIVHSGDLGGSIHSLSGGSSAVSDDDYNNDDDEGSGTMVIRDEVMLERLHSGDYDATAAPGANGDDAAASVIVHSSRSEVQPSSSANSPRPWLNKYRSPETWERNIIALEKGEFTEDMNEEAFGKYVRNKPRPSAQQLFVQLSSPALLAAREKASASAPSSPSAKTKKKSKKTPSSAASSPTSSAPSTPH